MLDMFTSNMHKHKCTVRIVFQQKQIKNKYLHTTQNKKIPMTGERKTYSGNKKGK